jgi:hypothetical protein
MANWDGSDRLYRFLPAISDDRRHEERLTGRALFCPQDTEKDSESCACLIGPLQH